MHIITRAKNIQEKENPHPSNLWNVSSDFSNVGANMSPFGLRETRGCLWGWKPHRPSYSHKKIIAQEKRQENMLLPIMPALQSHPTPPRKVPSQCHQLDLRYPSEVSSNAFREQPVLWMWCEARLSKEHHKKASVWGGEPAHPTTQHRGAPQKLSPKAFHPLGVDLPTLPTCAGLAGPVSCSLICIACPTLPVWCRYGILGAHKTGGHL